MRIIKKFNQENPSRVIHIEEESALGGEDSPITTFDMNSDYKNHYIIVAIREASEKKRRGVDVFYRKWNKDIQRQLDDVENYDIIKKRKAMDSAPADEENTPEALAAFESFEASVLPALEMIAQYENKFLRQEMVEMEESFAKGEAATGGVYFAWSPCLGCMKIGATHKEDPDVRLRQISSFVTTPFILVAWLPTPTPFRMEAAAHRHFSQQRINSRGSGAGTEFFRIGEAEAVTYVAGV